MTTDPLIEREKREILDRDREDDDFATREFRIEECVTDIVEQMWEIITSDNDIILDKIDDLAGELDLSLVEDAHAQLMDMVTRGAWMGLIGKIGEELCQLQLRDIEGEFA